MTLALPETFHFDGQAVRWGRIGSGPPLVFVHGTPFSSHVWRRIAPLLAESRSVYFFDLLGYGRSDMREGQDVSLGVQNRVLAALLRHWDLASPDVVAHDFGGATALRCHLLDRADYCSLTLIDPVALRPWGSPFVQHVLAHEAAFAGLPAYIHRAILDAYIAGAAFRSLPQSELDAYATPWTGPVGQAGFYRQIAQMDQRYTDEIAALLPAMRTRVSILWGREDAWIPPQKGEQLAALIPGATLHLVPEAGHLVQEDAPEAVVAHVLRFIAAR